MRFIAGNVSTITSQLDEKVAKILNPNRHNVWIDLRTTGGGGQNLPPLKNHDNLASL